jgi:hypothetical protein
MGLSRAKRETALGVLPLKRLEELADKHGLGVTGRRTKLQCIQALLGSRRVAFDELLTKLLRRELMKICTKLKLDSSGRTKAELIARLIAPVARSTSNKEPVKHRPSQNKSSTQQVKRRQAVLRNRARASTALGWDDIKAEALLALEPREFELFCRELLDCEWVDRHVGVKAVEGPPPPYGAGSDLKFEVTHRPHISREEYKSQWGVLPLTPDELGTVVYSCKTGSTWWTELQREAGTGSEWARETLQAGGGLTIMVHGVCADSPEKRRKLAKRYAGRMRNGKPGEPALEQRITIIDANDLALFLRGRKPIELSARLRGKLGVDSFPGLLSIEEWASHHGHDRGEPEFQWDEHRERVSRLIVDTLASTSQDAYARAIWLTGPPGVGKTRLLLESLRRHDAIRKRVLVAPTSEDGVKALRDDRLVQRHPTAVLVVDDCPEHDLDWTALWLARDNQGATGGLIVITPMAPDQASISPVSPSFRRCAISIAPMEREAHQALIRNEIGPVRSDEEVDRIASLTEGYPWFATLVAREIGQGAAMPRTVADAARLALCSNSDASRRDTMYRRARALLLVMITEDVNWHRLDDAEREALCRGVKLDDWRQFEREVEACRERGLLRMRLIFKYVTPAILGREVARMLLVSSDGGGRASCGPDLHRHARRFLPGLYQSLERLRLDASVLADLAEPIVRTLEAARLPDLDSPGGTGISEAELDFAVRHQPEQVARVLARWIDREPLESLRERTAVRRTLIRALQELHRRPSCFLEAEAALFRLACAENEIFGNNATALWQSLFTGNVHQPVDVQWELLRERCLQGEVAERLIALGGIRAGLLSRDRVAPRRSFPDDRLAHFNVDLHSYHREGWRLLADCMAASDAGVVAHAGEIAAECLAGAVNVGLAAEVAAMLDAVVAVLDELTRRKLREAFSCIDTRRLETSEVEVWHVLGAALQPNSFGERLRQQVGSWIDPADADEVVAQDRALAREGLTPPEMPLLHEIAWLCSADAVRRASFTLVVGMEDVERVAGDALIDRARSDRAAAELLSAYLVGWQRAGREAEVDGLLAALAAEPALAEAVALTIGRLGASDARIDLLLDVIARNVLTDHVFRAFTLGAWDWDVSDAALQRVVETLLGCGSLHAREVAMILIVNRLWRLAPRERPWPPELEQALRRWQPVLEQCLRGTAPHDLSGKTGSLWQRGARLLREMGGNVAEIALLGLTTSSSPGRLGHPAWTALADAAEHDAGAVWSALVAAEAHAGPALADALAMGLRHHHVTRWLDAEAVRHWIGRRADRATWMARAVSMHLGHELPALARALLVRFGPNSEVAAVLGAVFQSTYGRALVPSATYFYRHRIEQTRQWSTDSHPYVRDWAAKLLGALEERYEYHLAYEEHERRRWTSS